MLLLLADYLQEHVKGSVLYGFKGGPAGIMKCKYVELTDDFIYPYRNQVILVLHFQIGLIHCIYISHLTWNFGLYFVVNPFH